MSTPGILERVGNTPLVCLKMDEYPSINLYIKLEGYNPTGSVKDRAAFYILNKLLNDGIIDKDTTILESTSGNFGVALSAYCRYFGLNFIAVVDPHITAMNEMLIKANSATMIKVTQPDKTGGYLLTRIEKVNELRGAIGNSYWVNQYENPLNAGAYYYSLGEEICTEVRDIDYVFLGVSSGGTIAGVSRRVKEKFPGAKVIAVDVKGSVIFNNPARKRHIPGIGSSMVPAILKEASIDEVVITDEVATINACHELLENHYFFPGGSSGSVFSGIKKYFAGRLFGAKVNVVAVFPDRGERYYDTIYNKSWCEGILRTEVTAIQST